MGFWSEFHPTTGPPSARRNEGGRGDRESGEGEREEEEKENR